MSSTIEKSAAVKNGVGRLMFTGVSVIIEFLIMYLIVFIFSQVSAFVYVGIRVLAIFVVLYLYEKSVTSAMKMSWIILIMATPVLGMTLYCLIGLNGSTKKMANRFIKADEYLLPMMKNDKSVVEHAYEKDKRIANMSKLLMGQAQYPLYENTEVTYYDDGAKGIEAQKEELKKAKDFIFMEYHAIEDAESWSPIADILEEKAKEGVEVRLFYDDMGSIGFINTDFVKRMEARGVKTRVFNPFAPGINVFLNNRDHRKITVIDGKVGFTGGYNIANEYFHITEPFGYWKDTGVKLVGDAVQALTITFLEMWEAISDKDKEEYDIKRFLPEVKSEEYGGFVQPYADSPMDELPVGEDVYINMASSAQDYAWFITPYLIITDEMTHALTLAAKRGVDVRVITPGIPDKKIVYSVTRSYYSALAKKGVRVFEYTPGFCHCKMSISDDMMATCGTINMDFRSLYHHFENGCFFADNKAVLDMKADFDEIISQSTEVTDYYANGRGAFMRFGQMILRLVSPLL